MSNSQNNAPYGYCRCGCGEKAPLAKKNDASKGLREGQPYRFLPNHHGRLRAQAPKEKFLKALTKEGPGDCWNWGGRKRADGYGLFGYTEGHKWHRVYAHRFSYELFVGPIPAGLVIDHLCRNPSCVNPEHLEPVPHEVNIARGFSPWAVNARKTHCKRGHEFTLENTWVNTKGHRVCRTCKREYQRTWRRGN